MKNEEVTSIKVKLEDLHLDIDNPRFTKSIKGEETDIIRELVSNYKVMNLIHGIARSKKLHVGERIIVCIEDDKYIVLEGNRRVCACKILMNPQLLRGIRTSAIDEIDMLRRPTLLNNIQEIEVDVVKNRMRAQGALASKHVSGIKKWSENAKDRYIGINFDKGMSIFELVMSTELDEARIIKGIKNYRLLNYIIDLDKWTENERKSFINKDNIILSRVTKILYRNSGIRSTENLEEILTIRYDENFNIYSVIDKEVLDDVLYTLARAAYIDNAQLGYSKIKNYTGITSVMICMHNHKLLTEEMYTRFKSVESNMGYNQSRLDLKSGKIVEGIDPFVFKNYTRKTVIPKNSRIRTNDDLLNIIIKELKKLNMSECLWTSSLTFQKFINLILRKYLIYYNKESLINDMFTKDMLNKVIKLIKEKRLLSDEEYVKINSWLQTKQSYYILEFPVEDQDCTSMPSMEEIKQAYEVLESLLVVCTDI